MPETTPPSRCLLLLSLLFTTGALAEGDGGITLPSYGAEPMVEVAPDVFVDPAATREHRARLATLITESRARLSEVLGPLVSSAPLAVFCHTDPCRRFFAGEERRSGVLVPGHRLPTNARYVPTRPTIVLMSVEPAVGATVVHELLHVEVSARLRGASVPVWFEEGLATWVSDNVPCPERTTRAIDDLSRLARDPAWWNFTNQRHAMRPAYCQVRDEVARWVARHDRKQLVGLLDAVAAGASFDASYGPLLTTRPEGRLHPVVTASTEVGDPARPFTLATWVKPTATVGVIAFLSEAESGTGWATPMLGFDASGLLVSQVLFGNTGGPESFAVARAPKRLPLDVWSHVAMTWTPKGDNVLLVNGAEVARVAAPKYLGNGAGRTTYVSWGTYNLAGIDLAWHGAVSADHLAGEVAMPRVFPTALTPEELKGLVRSRP